MTDTLVQDTPATTPTGLGHELRPAPPRAARAVPLWATILFVLVTLNWLAWLTFQVRDMRSERAVAVAAAAPTGAAQLAGLVQARGAVWPHAVDSIGSEKGIWKRRDDTFDVPANEALVVRGWAFDGAAKLPGTRVVLLFDGAETATQYGAARPDVAKALDNSKVESIGYMGAIPASLVTPGTHELSLAIVSADGKRYFRSPVTIAVRAE